MKTRKGFSIVEVIVATAILLVLTTILTTLLVAGLRFYRKHAALVAMQMEAQIVMAQIREIVEDSTAIGGGSGGAILTAERETDDSILYHTLEFKSGDGTIEYTYEVVSADDSKAKPAFTAILAENVVSPTAFTPGSLVTVTLKLRKLGVDWEETQMFARRNP